MDTATSPAPDRSRVTFADIFSTSWDIFKAHFKTIVPLVLVVYIPAQLLTLMSRYAHSADVRTAAGALASLISLTASFWVVVTINRLVERAWHAQPAFTFAEAFRAGNGWAKLFGTTLLQSLIMAGIFLAGLLIALALASVVPHAYIAIVIGVVVLVGLLIAMYLGVLWTFTSPIVTLVGSYGLSAMRASTRLVKNQWWRVFGYSLLLGVIIAGLSLACAIPYGVITAFASGRSPYSEFIFSLITDVLVAFALVFKPVFYLLLRKEKGE